MQNVVQIRFFCFKPISIAALKLNFEFAAQNQKNFLTYYACMQKFKTIWLMSKRHQTSQECAKMISLLHPSPIYCGPAIWRFIFATLNDVWEFKGRKISNIIHAAWIKFAAMYVRASDRLKMLLWRCARVAVEKGEKEDTREHVAFSPQRGLRHTQNRVSSRASEHHLALIAWLPALSN